MRDKLKTIYTLFVGLSLWSMASVPSMAQQTQAPSESTTLPQYKIGVLAFRGEDRAIRRWESTANYLNEHIQGSRFVVEPMGLEQLRDAVSHKAVDFVLTNTGQYVELEAFYGVSRIATQKNNINGKVSTVFAAVIFTRADRDDVNSIEDLKGKRFMGVKRSGFGGFQMAWREMKAHGLDPFTQLQSLQFSGFPQDDVAYAVRDGEVDAGTFRSESLEQMDREGKIKLSEFKIINRQLDDNYDVLHSTRLYPVWPFARLSHTSIEVSEKVAAALISMPADHEAAIDANILGWTIPVNYQPVHEMMRELKVGSYKGMGEVSFKTFIKLYWPWITGIGFILSLLVVVTVVLRRTNRELTETQRSLSQHQAELVYTVHARTSDLVVMRDQALAASEAKSVFLSKVSHELRTPLNAIIGYTEILIDDLLEQGKDNPHVRELRSIRVSALHLLSIITDILDITRLEKGAAQLEMNKFSVSKLIGDVMAVAQVAAGKKGNKIQIHNNLNRDFIESDRDRVCDALMHVMDNACKYTSAGVIILEISGKNEKEDMREILFKISDNGIGMSPEQQEKIFNVFVQGDDSSTRQFDGLGLGLAKSRGYCRLLGGDITFSSEEGKGSVFEIVLPVKFILEQSKQAAG